MIAHTYVCGKILTTMIDLGTIDLGSSFVILAA